MRANRPARTRVRSSGLLLPAWFGPSSSLRTAFHRLRGVDISDGVEIGYFVIIDHLYPERVHIGRKATIAARSTILAHDESQRYARGGVDVVRDTRIGDFAFIGVHSVVLAGVTIGSRAIIGAGSVVTRDVAPEAVVAGVPARPIHDGSAGRISTKGDLALSGLIANKED